MTNDDTQPLYPLPEPLPAPRLSNENWADRATHMELVVALARITDVSYNPLAEYRLGLDKLMPPLPTVMDRVSTPEYQDVVRAHVNVCVRLLCLMLRKPIDPDDVRITRIAVVHVPIADFASVRGMSHEAVLQSGRFPFIIREYPQE